MPEQHGGGVGGGGMIGLSASSLSLAFSSFDMVPTVLWCLHGIPGSLLGDKQTQTHLFSSMPSPTPILKCFFFFLERFVTRKDPHSAMYTANGFSCNRSMLELILLLCYEDKAQGRWEREWGQGEHKLLLSVACAGKKNQTHKCFPGCSSLGW